jgi:hypothetical protein
MDELNAIVGALAKLEQPASFAQKYGPFFFAVLLLVLAPFLCRLLFAKSFGQKKQRASDPEYQDFRFYFRSTIVAGLICTALGVLWFFYENYNQVTQTNVLVAELKKKVTDLEGELKGRYNTVAGLISAGLEPEDQLHAFLDPQRSTVVARAPESKNSWFFIIISDDALTSPFEVNLGWSRVGTEAGTQPVVTIPVQITTQKRFANYRFSLAGGDTAKLEPLRY